MAWSAVASLRKALAIANGDEKLALVCVTDWLTTSLTKPSPPPRHGPPPSSTSATISTTSSLDPDKVHSYESVWSALRTVARSSSPMIQLTFTTIIMRIAQETYRQWNEQSLKYKSKRYHYYHDLEKTIDTRYHCTEFLYKYYASVIEIVITYMVTHTETQVRIAAVECFEYLTAALLLLPTSSGYQPGSFFPQIFSILYRTAIRVQLSRTDEESYPNLLLPIDPFNFSISISSLTVPMNDDGSLLSQYHEASLLGLRALFYGILHGIEQISNSDGSGTDTLSVNTIYELLYSIMEYRLDPSSSSSSSSLSTTTTNPVPSLASLSLFTYMDRYSKVSKIDAIREATFHCTESILHVLYELSKADCLITIPEKRSRITTLINASLLLIGQGMDDISIRVRFAACTCVRTLVNKFPQYIQQYFLIFLPRLCFTRYFGPDRQRMYCVDTWRQLITYLEHQHGESSTSNDDTVTKMHTVPEPSETTKSTPISQSTVSTIIQRSISPIAGQKTNESISVRERIFTEETAELSVSASSIIMNRSVSPSRSSSPIQRVIDRVITPPRTFPSSNEATINRSTEPSSSSSSSPSSSPSSTHHRTTVPASSPGLSIAAVAALAPGAERNSAIGPQLVARYIEPIVMYYRSALAVPYPHIQEAACHCIAELATKIDPTAVSPYAASIIESLLILYSSSMKDLRSTGNSTIDVNPSSANFSSFEWNVRDAAIIALGKMYVSHAEKSPSVQNLLPQILVLLFQSLYDPIRAVREHSAMIFGLYTASLLSSNEMQEETTKPAVESSSVSVSSPDKHVSPSVIVPNSSSTLPSTSNDGLSARLKPRSPSTAVSLSDTPGTNSDSSRTSSLSLILLNKVYYYVITTGLTGKVPEISRILSQLESFFSFYGISLSTEAQERLGKQYYSQESVHYVPSRISIMEGSLFLYREYCASAPDTAATILDIIADTAADTQATAPSVQETIWRILPVCAVSLGSKRLKRYLDVLIVPLGNCLLSNVTTMNTTPPCSPTPNGNSMVSGTMNTPSTGTSTVPSRTAVPWSPSGSTSNNQPLTAENRSRIWSVTDCIRQLANLVGVSIFRARLSSTFSPGQVAIILNSLGNTLR